MKYKSAPRFVFLEFLDPEIHEILNGLKNIFGHADVKTKIHITVRGPYYRSISERELNKYKIILEQDPILIQGAGIFEKIDEYIVYVKVQNEGLRRIWWKPNYPIKQYGFNPHITIYEGKDSDLAKKIYTFLKKEQLILLCHNFRLAVYVSKQGSLFPNNDQANNIDFLSDTKKLDSCIRRNFIQLFCRGCVSTDILERATILLKKHQCSKTYQEQKKSQPLNSKESVVRGHIQDYSGSD